ncbi:hypothetical protein MPSEU_000224100 [Mayamaea pseudoterrestris]|nr:hypothetical protein MPSEU_000224100 [Mayamaea pseudoterrestris]
MRLFGNSHVKKTNDGGLGLMLEQRKFSVISQVIMQDPVMAQELLGGEGILFTFLKHHAPADLMAIVVGVVREDALVERDAKGRTPLHVAILSNCGKEIISALLVKKAAKSKDLNGRVPLHYAVSNKVSSDIIKSLLRAAPAALHEEDETGSTPLELATKLDTKLADLLQDFSISMSSSIRKSGSRNSLRDESERSARRSTTSSDHLRRRSDKFELDSGHFTVSSSSSSKDLSKKDRSKEFSKSSIASRDYAKPVVRSTSHESLDKKLLHKSSRAKASKSDVPSLIDPASKPVSFDDSLSTIGTGWEKPALPMTGNEWVERLAQRATISS